MILFHFQKKLLYSFSTSRLQTFLLLPLNHWAWGTVEKLFVDEFAIFRVVTWNDSITCICLVLHCQSHENFVSLIVFFPKSVQHKNRQDFVTHVTATRHHSNAVDTMVWNVILGARFGNGFISMLLSNTHNIETNMQGRYRMELQEKFDTYIFPFSASLCSFEQFKHIDPVRPTLREKHFVTFAARLGSFVL